MADPWLLTLRDGALLCVHFSYRHQKQGLRAITSRDGGKTWSGVGSDYGFATDPTVYGYSRGIQLPRVSAPAHLYHQIRGCSNSRGASATTSHQVREGQPHR